MDPITIAALISGGAQLGKGIMNYFAANKQKKEATKIMNEGNSLINKAWQERKDYQVPTAVTENLDRAKGAIYDNSLQNSMQAKTGLAAANAASKVSRSATTFGQAALGATLAAQMEAEGATNAAYAGAQQRFNAMQLAQRAGSELGQYQTRAYEYNTVMPFNANLEWGMSKYGAGLQGRITGDNNRQMAVSDAINGLSDSAMLYGKYAKG